MTRAGRGFEPGNSPPYGRRKWAFAGIAEDDTPTTDWASLVASGYHVAFGVVIEGIPVSFGERKLYTVTGTVAEAPSDDYTQSYALVVSQGMSTSCEIDRETGLAAGRALDLVLGRQQLGDEILLATLFKRPGASTSLTEDITDEATTVFPVTSTASFSSSGTAWIGRECIRYTSTDSTSFAGVRRGVCGLPHYHIAREHGYGLVTDVPVYWRGRLVTIYEHLVSPEGRYLGERWNTVGTYCRERWLGFIDAVPQQHQGGFVLRCLPIERLAEMEIGAKFTGRMAYNSENIGDSPLIAITDTDILKIRGNLTSTIGQGPHDGSALGLVHLDAWCKEAAADIETDIGTANIEVSGQASIGRSSAGYATFNVRYPGGTTSGTTVDCKAWFIDPNTPAMVSATSAAGVATVTLVVNFNGGQTAWLPIRFDSTEDFVAADVPSQGYGLIESDGKQEFVRWDQKTAHQYNASIVAFRLVGRRLLGSSLTDPWTNDCTFTVLSGADGKWGDVFRTLVTSSGLGARGAYDVLGYGYGLGLPLDRIDEASLKGYPLADADVTALGHDRSGISKIMCGWLALWGRCLVQRRLASGRMVLAVVSTEIVDDPSATAIAEDDVLLGGHGTPELIEAPNEVVVESSKEGAEPIKTVVRDVARVASEGPRALRLSCPGATHLQVYAHAVRLLQIGDGQASLVLEAPPWCELQPGDAVTLETAHPLVYDWSTGAYAPASVLGRVVGVEADLWAGVVRVTLLIEGQQGGGVYLCPSARVVRVVSATTIEVREGDAEHFAAGYKVYVYEPGQDDTRKDAMTVDSVDEDASTITFTSSLSSWVDGYSAVTFDDYTTSTTTQKRLMFQRSDKRFT